MQEHLYLHLSLGLTFNNLEKSISARIVQFLFSQVTEFGDFGKICTVVYEGCCAEVS